ncbi:hypothetical protein AAFN86_28245 [Roseomonas sp. CAU 1739]|uniref:hypothetical protein n=1 Tax=Roseomonas sp. CAU 1739 TaxID=3140364 RepID=UPI00325AF905
MSGAETIPDLDAQAKRISDAMHGVLRGVRLRCERETDPGRLSEQMLGFHESLEMLIDLHVSTVRRRTFAGMLAPTQAVQRG